MSKVEMVVKGQNGEAAEEDVQDFEDQDLQDDEDGELKTPETVEPSNEWKHKYDVINGKYTTEVPRLAERVRFLEGMLAGMGEVKPTAASADSSIDDESVSNLKTEYPDIYSGVVSLVRSELASVTQNMDTRFKDVETSSTRTSQGQFHALLDTRVPGWREINDDPQFMNWLQGKEKYSPYSRHELLLAAYDKLDLETVSEFFTDYAAATGKKLGYKQKLTAPSSSPRASTPKHDPNKKMYTQKEIQDFYKNVATGRIKLDPAKQKEMEDEYMSALQEGRVSG